MGNYPKCYDCELNYKDFPCELVIAHDAWEIINPSPDKGAGLLCHNCMIERMIIKNMGIVDILHFSVQEQAS